MAKLSDYLTPLVICHQFDFVHDLAFHRKDSRVSFKFTSSMSIWRKIDCNETTIKALLASDMSIFPVEELVEEIEKRNRLNLVLQ